MKRKQEVDFSIIVPSFMQATYLAACLESIVKQKGVTFEILLFDSCSTDGTDRVLELYSEHVSHMEVKRDLGQAHAINKGLKIARGKYLCYLNSDDVFCDDALSFVAREFESDGEVQFVYGKADYIDQKGVIVGQYRVFSTHERSLFDECVICQPAAFWRADLSKRLGCFEQNLEYSMDYDYWLRVYESGAKVKMVDRVLAYSRDYPETKTRSGAFKIFHENFRILLRRKGYISYAWLTGYMGQLLKRQTPVLCRLIPKKTKNRILVGRVLSKLSRFWASDTFLVTEKKYNRVI